MCGWRSSAVCPCWQGATTQQRGRDLRHKLPSPSPPHADSVRVADEAHRHVPRMLQIVAGEGIRLIVDRLLQLGGAEHLRNGRFRKRRVTGEPDGEGIDWLT